MSKNYGCAEIGGRLNYDAGGRYSFCHFFETSMARLEYTGTELTPEIYDMEVRRMRENLQEESCPCRSCSNCKENVPLEKQIFFVTINTSGYCNSNCVYCGSYGVEGEGYDPLPSLERFHKEERFRKNCLFDWGGGEPTLNPYFESVVKWLLGNHYKQRINTNAIVFSPAAYAALENQLCTLRISVDAGSEAVFRKVKGHTHYEEVWKNIKKYCEASPEVYIKYNIFHFNSELEEADIFLDNCQNAGVRHIYVEAEHFSYGRNRNVGPLFFGQKELEFAQYLYRRACERGFDAIIAGGFTWRSTDKKPRIPDKLESNIDWEILKNNIGCETFATVEDLLAAIDTRDVVVWGAGKMGTNALRRLKNGGKHVVCVADSNPDKWGTVLEGVKVCSPEEASAFKDAVVILGAGKYAEMLRIINEQNWSFWRGNIYYMLAGKWLNS